MHLGKFWMPAFAGMTSKRILEHLAKCGSAPACKADIYETTDCDVLMSKSLFVYILASNKNGTLYIGVTNDLIRRVHEHKADLIEGFTKKYQVHRLVYFERCDDPREAILREKRLKKWNRDWKIKLIEENNPEWEDLYDKL